MTMEAFKKIIRSFFYYETVKIVTIKNLTVGVLNRLIQLAIFLYIAVYAIYLKQGYQDFSEIESSVTSKVKGIAYTDFNDTEFNPLVTDPQLYKRVWDVADYVVPPSENGAFFVATNVIITPNQTQSTCPEDPTAPGALCNETDPDACIKGDIPLLGNGVRTGRCVPSDFPGSNQTVCEIQGWCPVEKDILPLKGGKSLLEASKEFTVLLKNNIKFAKFNVNRRNILDTTNGTYLKGCTFNEVTDTLCPVFKLKDIVRNANQKYSEIALKGGVMAIVITWNCNLDLSLSKCIPRYSFERLDDPNAQLAKGWNFRYANYFGDNSRTLYKVYGIRFVVLVQGRGGKFSLVPLLITIGSGLGLLAVASVLCDLVVLYILKMKNYYKTKKYLYVEGDDDQAQLVNNMIPDPAQPPQPSLHESKVASHYHSFDED